MRAVLTSLLALSVLAGCELAEVAAPASDDVLVVDAVLRGGPGRQVILLHRSIEERVIRGESGATVTVSRADGSETIAFQEAPSPKDCFVAGSVDDLNGLDLEASCYISPWVEIEPGATYDLRVETAGGEMAYGRTQVPGGYRFATPEVDPGAGRTWMCRLPAAPFELGWTASAGAWAYVITLSVENYAPDEEDLPDPVELTSVSVSAADTSLLFPKQIGLFQRGDVPVRVYDILDQGIPAQADALLSVVATDRNYTNAIRGGRFNPSGNIRVNSIAGDGVGIFGSVTTIQINSQGGTALCPGVAAG